MHTHAKENAKNIYNYRKENTLMRKENYNATCQKIILSLYV